MYWKVSFFLFFSPDDCLDSSTYYNTIALLMKDGQDRFFVIYSTTMNGTTRKFLFHFPSPPTHTLAVIILNIIHIFLLDISVSTEQQMDIPVCIRTQGCFPIHSLVPFHFVNILPIIRTHYQKNMEDMGPGLLLQTRTLLAREEKETVLHSHPIKYTWYLKVNST